MSGWEFEGGGLDEPPIWPWLMFIISISIVIAIWIS